MLNTLQRHVTVKPPDNFPQTESRPEELADPFNKYFSTTGAQINNELGEINAPEDALIAFNVPGCDFKLNTVSIQTVKRAVQSMAKKAAENDQITIKLLKTWFPAMAACYWHSS